MNREIRFLLYNAPNGEGKVQVAVRDETLWMTQQAMAALFGTDRSVITKHLGNIFKSLELERERCCANFAQHLPDGRTYNVLFYNLDAIISVGYRVNSAKATRFRQWATGILAEYIRKGFVMDDERLKQGEGLRYGHQSVARGEAARAEGCSKWGTKNSPLKKLHGRRISLSRKE